MAFTEDDILFCPPPLFHCFGLVLGLLATLTHGGKIVYPTETFDAAACLRAISDERCTAIHGVPAMFDTLLSLPRPSNFNCTALRTGIIAGAPVPRHLMNLLVHDLGMTQFTSSYGLTEASPTCFNAQHTDPIPLKLSTVGHIMPHAIAKVVDRDGHTVPLGTKGELWISGYQLQKGYWNNHEKTAETMTRDENGVLWLHTGDEVMFHPDGTCTITGRFKDIIIRGGENIYPLEVEETLVQHPAIARAIVVGVRNDHYGEVVAAFLQRKASAAAAAAAASSHPSNDEIKQFTRQTLGRHKAPVHIFWLGEDGVPGTVPLTGSGKLKKFEMARWGEEIVRRNAKMDHSTKAKL